MDRIFIHYKYNKINFDNDIAVLKLKKCLYFHNDVQPACLPESSTYDVKFGVASVWRRINGNSYLLKSLKAIGIFIICTKKSTNVLPKQFGISD